MSNELRDPLVKLKHIDLMVGLDPQEKEDLKAVIRDDMRSDVHVADISKRAGNMHVKGISPRAPIEDIHSPKAPNK